MSYIEMSKFIINLQKKRTSNVRHSNEDFLSNEPRISIVHPGYKGLNDFLVRLDGEPIRHDTIVNILFDMVLRDSMKYESLRNMVFDLAVNGNSVIQNTYIYLANDTQDASNIELLITTIPWIALQEDTNYPIPRYQGRKMPFYRYIEGIEAARFPNNINRLYDVNTALDCVIERTNTTGIPPQPINSIDYGIIDNLK